MTDTIAPPHPPLRPRLAAHRRVRAADRVSCRHGLLDLGLGDQVADHLPATDRAAGAADAVAAAAAVRGVGLCQPQTVRQIGRSARVRRVAQPAAADPLGVRDGRADPGRDVGARARAGYPAAIHFWADRLLACGDLLALASRAGSICGSSPICGRTRWCWPGCSSCRGWTAERTTRAGDWLAKGARLLWAPIAALALAKLSVMFVVPEKAGPVHRLERAPAVFPDLPVRLRAWRTKQVCGRRSRGRSGWRSPVAVIAGTDRDLGRAQLMPAITCRRTASWRSTAPRASRWRGA